MPRRKQTSHARPLFFCPGPHLHDSRACPLAPPSLAVRRVAEVRAAAISQAGNVLAQLLRDEPQPLASDSPTAAFLSTVCGMATAPSCHKRANFVQICASLVRALDSAVIIAHVLPHLTPLATDRVANVRLPLGELLVAELLPHECYASLPAVVEMAATLRADSDRDVLRAVHDAGFEPPPYRCKAPPATPSAADAADAAAPAADADADAADAPPGADNASSLAPPADGDVRPELQQGADGQWLPRNSLGPNGAVAGPDAPKGGTGAAAAAAELRGDEPEPGDAGLPPEELVAAE